MKSITVNNIVNNTINNSTKKIILAVVIVAVVLGLFFWLTYTNHKAAETFISPDELKARSAAMPPAPDKVCEKPGDPVFVGQNYSVCCPTAEKSPNCLCRLPSIKSCQTIYGDCISGNMFSKESRDFLGEDNMPTICNKIVNGCITGLVKSDSGSNSSTLLTNMKPDLSNSANLICSVDGYKKDNLAEFCSQTCQQIPGCQYYQTDNIMGSCGLYKGAPVPLEKGAQANSLGNYQLFTLSPKSTDTKENFTDAAEFCRSGTVDKCSNKSGISTNNCLCSHSVVKDCHKLYQKCIKDGVGGEKCRAQFGSCCGLIDSADPQANASMSTQPKIGTGRQSDILCSRSEITSLVDCSAACLRLDTCDFINTNLQEIAGDAGSKRRGLTNDGQAPYCQLFKGQPLNTHGVILGKQTSTGKTIYMKQRGNPDEREINAELAKK